MKFLRRIHRLVGGGRMVSAVAITLGLCVLFFLTADALGSRYPRWGALFRSMKELAPAVIAAFIVVLVDHSVTIGRVATEVTRQMQAATNKMMELFIIGSAKSGLVAVHESLDFAALFEDLQEGEELLWHDTYCPRSADFISKVRPALERGAKLRMLIIDPACENSKSRAREINEAYEPSTFAKEADVFVSRINATVGATDATRSPEESRAVLMYDDLPCMPMYIITRDGVPSRGYSGFFLTEPSAYSTHLEWVYAEGGVLEKMHAYFEQKWRAQKERQKKSIIKRHGNSGRLYPRDGGDAARHGKVQSIKRA
jgi:hypothetical protein